MKQLSFTLLLVFFTSAHTIANWHHPPLDTLKDDLKQSAKSKADRLGGSRSAASDFTSNSTKRKADDLFNQLGYLAATDYYLQLDELSEMNYYVKMRLATSYRLNGMTEDAEYWYAQIINEADDSLLILHYAQMLQSNGKCEDAVRWYDKYTTMTNDNSRSYISDCEELETFKETANAFLVNLEGLNSPALDFSPIKYKNGVVFTSTRGIQRATKNIDKWSNGNFSDLFFAEKKGEAFKNPKPLQGDINGRFHDGVATFDRSGTYMIFTRNSTDGKSSDGVRDLKLYEAHFEAGQWGRVKELNISDEEFASAHPTLSADGKRLYFASNRSGTLGGMDIFVSNKRGGSWSEPQNLGPIINTPGNEVFPHIDADEKLYYSSDGHLGLGGLDIFMAQKSDNADELSWGIRENLGKPFNSVKDDFGFVILEPEKTGYLTSSRSGGMGEDDIYRWEMGEGAKLTPKKNRLDRKFCVFDVATNDRIEGVRIDILPADAGAENLYGDDLALTLQPIDGTRDEYKLGITRQGGGVAGETTQVTDKSGAFRYTIGQQQDYLFVLNKKGYQPIRHNAIHTEVMKQKEYCIGLERKNCLILDGWVQNRDYETAIPFAKLELFNKCTGETVTAVADEEGSFDFCLECNCEYEVVASKERFSNGFAEVSTREIDCDEMSALSETIELEILDRAAWEQQQRTRSSTPYGTTIPRGGATYPQGSYPSGQGSYVPETSSPRDPFGSNSVPSNVYPNYTKEQVLTQLLGDPYAQLEAGQILTLNHIYYDFNKYYIRDDAENELDYIAALMRIYPTLEISLTSHTDSRGTNNYNQWLSRKRAKAALKYLQRKGVNAARIHDARGFGEEQLINDCYDGIDCGEGLHQQNRRTEIRVEKI